MIRISNLSKSFKSTDKKNKEDFVVIDNLNLEIKDDTIFGIIGLSGAGKTTLLKLLTLLEKPTSGNIYVDDLNLSELSKKEVRSFRKNLGVVFQGYNLLMQENIYNNIAFPLKINKVDKEEINRTVIKLLELIGLSDKALSYPSMLSGGQMQRVAIARALATNPKILLLDEPTSALDPYTTNQIVNLLKEIKKALKITIIIITHEMSVVSKLCDEVAVLDGGCIKEVSTVKDLMDNPQTEIAKLLLGKEEI